MTSDCIVDEKVTIPKTENEITEEWIRTNLGVDPLPNSISVVGNIQDGVGFLSNLCRISFQNQDGTSQNILIKLLPSSPEYRALTLNEKFDEREIQFYSIVMPKIVEVSPNMKKNLCKIYCGKLSKSSEFNTDDDYASMIVMEDLKPLGYQMLNPESQHWRKNLEEVVKVLAKFHCASLTIEDMSGNKISEIFPFSWGTGEFKLDMLMEMAETNVKKLDTLLEEKNCSPILRAAYKKIAGNVRNHFTLTLEAASKHPCLIHGDIWPPNIMVAEREQLPVKLIDWQLLGYRDPAVELSVGILTCVPKAELKRETLNYFCKLYLETCESLRGNLGRSRSEFQEFFDTWGMIYGYIWLVLSFDSFPDDTERLIMLFEFLHNEYKINEFLKSKE